jgi:hypothetical protein
MPLTQEQRDQQPAFVAFGPCGHVVACAVDEPGLENENSQDVMAWIRSGLRVEKMTCIAVRAAQFCNCKRKEKEALKEAVK